MEQTSSIIWALGNGEGDGVRRWGWTYGAGGGKQSREMLRCRYPRVKGRSGSIREWEKGRWWDETLRGVVLNLQHVSVLSTV